MTMAAVGAIGLLFLWGFGARWWLIILGTIAAACIGALVEWDHRDFDG